MNLILILWKNLPLNLGELTLNSFNKLDPVSISDNKLNENSFDHISELKGRPSSGELT